MKNLSWICLKCYRYYFCLSNKSST